MPNLVGRPVKDHVIVIDAIREFSDRFPVAESSPVMFDGVQKILPLAFRDEN